MDDVETKQLKEAIQQAITRKLTQDGKFPHRAWKPYTNRDGTPSYQQKVWEAMLDPSLKEIYVFAANSVGKSHFVAMTIVYILAGDHKFCTLFNKPIHVHVISKKWSTQKDTIQGYLETMTNHEISGISGMGDKSKYYIKRDGDIIKTIVCRATGHKITFATAEEGAAGNVGIRPNLLLVDEPVSQALYTELTMRTTTENSKMVMLATVAEAEHAWVTVRANELLADPVPSIRIYTAGMADSPYVAQSEIEHRKATLGEDSADYRVRVLGHIEVVTGIVFQGMEKCLVDNDFIPEEYRQMSTQEQQRYYAWAESYDFGVGNKDPFIGCFFKLYANGLIVQEDEVVIYDGTPEQWADAIHRKREELDLPPRLEGYPRPNVVVDQKTQKLVRKPKFCFGDKQYLGRRVMSTNTLTTSFVRRKIYIEPSKGDPVMNTLPVCQDLVRRQLFLIKQRCAHSYKFARSYQTKYNESSGKTTYDSPYDHWSDCFRYLVERIGNMNRFVQDFNEQREFMRNTNLRQNVLNSVNKYRAI